MGKPRVKKVQSELDLNNGTEERSLEGKPEEPAENKEDRKAIVKKVKVKSKQQSKRFQDLLKKVEKEKGYGLEEAVEVVKNTSTTKFDSTIEAHLNLGIDVNQPTQQVRGLVILPHGTGKKPPKILVFASGKAAKEAEEEGAIVGDEQTIEKIQKGWLDFDKVVATPEMMSGLGKVAKKLGPKGLMPNPKTGTVTNDISKTVKDLKSGLIEFRTGSEPIIHTIFGKSSMEKEKLVENFKVLFEAISKNKPATSKDNFIKSIFVTSTMGPSVKLDLTKP